MGVSADERWMQEALNQAHKAAEAGEVPVGAVLVASEDDALIAAAHNAPLSQHDPSAHAEVQVLRAAGQARQNYRLPGTTLYVTIEPCMMCCGALVQARVDRLVFGASEPKAGAVVSHALMNADWLNHQIEVSSGVLAKECGQLMSDFFKNKRA